MYVYVKERDSIGMKICATYSRQNDVRVFNFVVRVKNRVSRRDIASEENGRRHDSDISWHDISQHIKG